MERDCFHTIPQIQYCLYRSWTRTHVPSWTQGLEVHEVMRHLVFKQIGRLEALMRLSQGSSDQDLDLLLQYLIRHWGRAIPKNS